MGKINTINKKEIKSSQQICYINSYIPTEEEKDHLQLLQL